MSMAIAETDHRKSDADETSTGGSKSNTLENESKNMFSGQGTSQLSPVDHRYFEEIKDLAFCLSGGWTDPTFKIFIDSCKTYLPDFQSATGTDDLKVWNKIVKKCREKSNYHSEFTVNTVLDLAKSLKAYVLSNENRKEKAFKNLYDYVIELIQFFPSESIGTMNQNLRQRSRSDSSDLASTLDAPEAAAVSVEANSIDHIVVKCCHDFQSLLESPKTSSKYVWSQLTQKIYENCGIKLDVKKHISDVKKNVIKETKKIVDAKKREFVFLELIGDYRFIFDFIPPLNVRVADYILETSNSNSDVATSHNATDDNNLAETTDKVECESYQKKGKKLSKTGMANSVVQQAETISEIQVTDTPKRVGRKEKSLSTEDTLEEVDPVKVRALRSRHPPQTPKKSPKKQNPQSDDFGDSGSPKVIKRGRGRPRRVPIPKKSKIKYTAAEESDSDSDVSSDDDNIYPKKHRVSEYTDREPIVNKSGSNDLRKKNHIQPINGWQTGHGQHKIKNGYTSPVASAYSKENNPPDENNIAGSNMSLTKPSMVLPASHRDQPLAPKTVETKTCISKPVQPSTSGEIPSQPIADINQMSSANLPTSEMNASRSNIAPVRPEPSPYHSSHSPRPSTSRECDINQRIHEGVDELNRLDASSVKMLEGLKEQYQSNTPASMMQLLPVSQAGCSSFHSDLAIVNNSRPPSWFDTFVCDYKKHEMWKMHQLLKMQQELVDMENKKLSVLEKILGSLNDK